MSASIEAPTLDEEARIKDVETLLDKLYDAGLFSVAALIAQDGQLLMNKAWGLADRKNNVPNTPQTIFRIGQMTMQVTAASVLLLEQEGQLDIQQPISAYLDDCPQAWQSITLHHLLSHTSGIPDYSETPAMRTLAKEGATPQQLLALFSDLPLSFEPGAQRVFNHAGFVVVGLIIERTSGQMYGDYVKEHIFEPLEMSSSGYGDPPEGLALGYMHDADQEPVAYDVSTLYASGGCYSTAEDLYRWNEGLYNGRLLNDAQLQKMLTPHINFGDEGNSSGYGIVLWEAANRKVAGNGGGPDGYNSVIYRYLDDRITSLLIGNQDMEQFVLLDQVERTFFNVN